MFGPRIAAYVGTSRGAQPIWHQGNNETIATLEGITRHKPQNATSRAPEQERAIRDLRHQMAQSTEHHSLRGQEPEQKKASLKTPWGASHNAPPLEDHGKNDKANDLYDIIG